MALIQHSGGRSACVCETNLVYEASSILAKAAECDLVKKQRQPKREKRYLRLLLKNTEAVYVGTGL